MAGLVPGGEPVQLPLQPGQFLVPTLIDTHRAAKHQGDAVVAVPGCGQRLPAVGPDHVELQPPFHRKLLQLVGALMVHVLDHQQGGGQSSR